TLAIAADYDAKSDGAHLESLSLTIDHLLQLHGSGSVSNVRHERNFSARLAVLEVDLERLAILLPPEERSRVVIGGKASCQALQLSGNASSGLSHASGVLLVHDGRLVRDGRAIFSGVAASVVLA